MLPSDEFFLSAASFSTRVPIPTSPYQTVGAALPNNNFRLNLPHCTLA
jgi:hypothetical protein